MNDSIQLKIQRAKSGIHFNGIRLVTDGDFCEQKAMEFEEQDLLRRFALRVSHVTGFEAPDCDILSFDTAESRDIFLNSPNKTDVGIARFIEVKGRSSEKARIELKGNELSAAERFRNRYYLYRLYEVQNGEFLLSVLRDPISEKDALKPIIEVNLDRAKTTERFTLTGGLLSNS